MKGIYKITQLSTGKVYIGSSKEVERRLTTHKCNLQKGKCDSVRLQQAYNETPDITQFSFEILEQLPEDCDKQLLLNREDYWMEYYHSRNPEFGLNWSKARYGGENHHRLAGENSPTFQRKHTQEECKKMRNSWTEERKKALSERTKKRWEDYRKTHH